MVKISIEKFQVDKREYLAKDHWFTYAAFFVAEHKKLLGFIPRKITFGHRIMFMVCDEGLTDKPVNPDITAEDFNKRLALNDYSETTIRKYAKEKVTEAAEKATSVEAMFDDLKQSFYVDD